MSASDDGFEHVYTMNDHHDGCPLTGIADFRGQPHAYDRPFDEASDDYVNWFELRPIDEETLRLALECWAIWIRWDDAYRAGLVDLSTHPAIPGNRNEHDESLNQALKARLGALPPATVRATGNFRAKPEDARRQRLFEVLWDVVR